MFHRNRIQSIPRGYYLLLLLSGRGLHANRVNYVPIRNVAEAQKAGRIQIYDPLTEKEYRVLK